MLFHVYYIYYYTYIVPIPAMVVADEEFNDARVLHQKMPILKRVYIIIIN